MSWREVRDLSDLLGQNQVIGPDEPIIGTPMRLCRVIHLADTGMRTSSDMRWGFVDRRARSPLERPKHMHARAETVDVLPTFAESFAHRRGILLTRTFNVGQELPNGKTIQHTITPRDGGPIAIAVIWEKWENRNEGALLTFVMVTTAPNTLIAAVADRMPAMLQPEDWPLWLGETHAAPMAVKSVLRTFDGDWEMAKQTRPWGHRSASGQIEPTLL